MDSELNCNMYIFFEKRKPSYSTKVVYETGSLCTCYMVITLRKGVIHVGFRGLIITYLLNITSAYQLLCIRQCYLEILLKLTPMLRI